MTGIRTLRAKYYLLRQYGKISNRNVEPPVITCTTFQLVAGKDVVTDSGADATIPQADSGRPDPPTDVKGEDTAQYGEWIAEQNTEASVDVDYTTLPLVNFHF
ncbi:hypothetical protein V5799_005280 [Amblyomma americanum]|uniref:Uncharacterized protein n=1 Tax=Amblyomma americanum TaxID=6943 RepID=A0AAQ4DZP5_AMBAM